MKKITGMAAILMVGLLSFGVLAGCSEEESSSSESVSSSSGSSESSSETSSSSEEEASEDVIGEITYLGSSTLVLDVYQPDQEVTDYTDMGDITLTEANETQSVTVDEDTVYQSVSQGTTTVITHEDLAEGDLVAVTTDEDGVQTILVLDAELPAEDLSSEEDSSLSQDPEVSTEESALEEATGEITSDET